MDRRDYIKLALLSVSMVAALAWGQNPVVKVEGDMFHTLDRSWRPMTEADYRLADEMMDCWTNFVKYGNPNGRSSESWKPFTLGNPYIKTFNVRYGE